MVGISTAGRHPGLIAMELSVAGGDRSGPGAGAGRNGGSVARREAGSEDRAAGAIDGGAGRGAARDALAGREMSVEHPD